MKLTYDIFNRTEPSHIYIAKPGKRMLGELNGVKEETCEVNINLNSTSTLSFEVDRIVNGEISNYYEHLEQHYELYVTGVGWFKINEEPEVYYDGKIETTSINAESLEIELQQYDKVGFRINCGTEDSWEMMAVDNVYEDEDGYRLPRESVLFYRNTEDIEELIEAFADTSGTLSELQGMLYEYPVMLDFWRITINLDTFDDAIRRAIEDMKSNGRDTEILESKLAIKNKTQELAKQLVKVYTNILKYAEISVDLSSDDDTPFIITEVLNRFLQNRRELSLMWLMLNEHGWKIRYVDDYVDTDTPKRLSDMVGRFEIDTQDIYTLLAQDISSYFKCIFVFNTEDYTVDAYKVENLGDDTNIFLSFHNVQNSITKSSDRKIYTVYHVSNDDTLNLREVNFGEDTIEDISYFLTTKHLPQELIDKYNRWKSTRESKRNEYCELSKKYRDQSDVVSEIYYRVPTDLVDTSQYSTFTDEQLTNERSGCEAQLKGYESIYVDEYGNFDLSALQSSPDWKTYKIIKEIVIPNLNVELYNRGLNSKDDYVDFNDDYEYDFATYGDSYGVKELEIYRDTLKNNIDLLTDKGYNNAAASGDEYHRKQHELYIKYTAAYESCLQVLGERESEYDLANQELDDIQDRRLSLAESVSKTNPEFEFTDEELDLLDKYYIHTDYVNQNIVTTSLDDNNSIINRANELYKDAEDQLYSDSHPQWNWTTTQDNLLIMPEFRDWHRELDIANFIRVSIRDDYQVKLRIISISLNPFMIDTDIGLTFSNMVQYRGKRTDYDSVLESNNFSGKNQITANLSNRNSNTETFNIDANLVRKLINNNAFSGYMNGIVSDSVAAISGVMNYIVTEKIDAIEINVKKITGTEAEFDELFTKYIDSDYINARVLISDVGEFKELSSEIAKFKTMLAGNVGIEDGYIFNLTTDNATMNEAFIKEIIASKLSVGDLLAGNIVLNDKMQIISQNGKMVMNGTALQLFGTDSLGNEYVGIQLGYDATNNPSLVLRNASGALLLTPQGITENAIADGLIKNDMVADGTIAKRKLDFEVIEPNEYGGIDITKIYNGDGSLFGEEMQTFKEKITEHINTLDDTIDNFEIGSRNLIRNSKTLDFESYYFTTKLSATDESGNYLTDENNNHLIIMNKEENVSA